MKQYSTESSRLLLTTVALAGAVAAGVAVATQFRRRTRSSPRRLTSKGVHVHEAITINRPLTQVYQYWRNFENFPRFMSHLEAVETTGAGRSRWRAKGPAGLRVEWEAEIIGDRENEWIAWRSIGQSDVQHSGAVRFEHAPGGRGTEVHVELQYTPPAGVFGKTLTRLFEDPETQIRDDLRRFKQILETGEVPVSDGPGLWRPAQPAERPEELKTYMGVLQ